jgi:hypothetical protein
MQFFMRRLISVVFIFVPKNKILCVLNKTDYKNLKIKIHKKKLSNSVFYLYQNSVNCILRDYLKNNNKNLSIFTNIS